MLDMSEHPQPMFCLADRERQHKAEMRRQVKLQKLMERKELADKRADWEFIAKEKHRLAKQWWEI